MRMMLPMLLLTITPLGCAAAPPTDPAEATQLLTDFSDDLAADDAHATVSLRLFDIRPMPSGGAGDVVVQLQRRAGQWVAEGSRAAADYNQRSNNTVAWDQLTLADGRLRGSLTVTITPDKPRPGGPAYLGPQPFPPNDRADVYQITLDAKLRNEATPFIADTQKQQPPWRKDVPGFGGQHITGNYTATRDGKSIKGKLTGAISPAGQRDVFTTDGNLYLEPAKRGGVAVLARLSPVRVADQYSATAMKTFAQPQDWSAYNALRVTVDAKKRRDDAAVALLVKQDKWVTRRVTAAALLLGGEHTFIVPFDDMNLGNRRAIEGVGFGVVNPHGVGDVEYTLRRIELVSLPELAPPPRPQMVALTIDPHAARVHNGVTDVPKGLFGHHEVNQGKATDDKAIDYLRTINPGYLRPLDHTGFGFKAWTQQQINERALQLERASEPEDGFYLRAKAADAIDNIVWCHTQDLFARPAWMDEGVEKWENQLRGFYREQAANAWRPGQPYNVLRRFEVWNEPFFWSRHTNEGHMAPPGKKAWTDPTQHGYIPGELGAAVYARMFKAAAEGAASANEHALLGGPSAPAFNADDYGNFTNYVARFIDAVPQDIDFLTEHHYGGNPESFAASYEVATAYADITHGRRLPVYNTEANNLGASDAGKAAYNLEDILHGILVNPDIYVGRALHALWSGYLRDEGELHVYRFLAPLRGTMLPAASDDEDVLLVASMPRPGRVILLAYNRGWSERQVALRGMDGFSAEGVTMLLADAPRGEQALRDPEGQPIPAPPQGKTSLVKLDPQAIDGLTIPPRSAVRITYAKPGHRPAQRRVTEQAFVDVVLQQVQPNAPSSGRIVWRGELRPKDAEQAVLRIITADVHRGEAEVVIGEQVIPLRFTDQLAGDAVAQTYPLNLEAFDANTPVTFRVTDPSRFNGFRVLAASVLLTRTEPNPE